MRKLLGLAVVVGLWGCARTPAPEAKAAPPPRPMQLSVKDAPASASDDDAIDDVRDGHDYEVVVKLKPAADMDAELRALDDAQPESFRWNSIEGRDDGIALEDVPDDESVDDALAHVRQDP